MARNIVPGVLHIADSFGITIETYDYPLFPGREHPKGDGWVIGPRLNTAINLSRRAVLFRDAKGSRLPPDRRYPDPETQLHELMHVIFQPPGMSIDEVPEEFILMQAEREFARHFFPREAYRRVCKWQRETELAAELCMTMEYVDQWWRAGWWREGYEILQRLGVLDTLRRPTMEQPRWSALSDAFESWKRRWM